MANPAFLPLGLLAVISAFTACVWMVYTVFIRPREKETEILNAAYAAFMAEFRGNLPDFLNDLETRCTPGEYAALVVHLLEFSSTLRDIMGHMPLPADAQTEGPPILRANVLQALEDMELGLAYLRFLEAQESP